MKEIEESKYLNEILQRRIQRMSEILKIYEIRIEFDENICLKQSDVEDLRKLIEQLTQTISNTSQTELLLRLKEREELALKTEFNNLKHKYDIVLKEKDFVEKKAKMLQENLKQSEEKLRQQKIDIHNEKRKNEFMSRRVVEMEKSLSAMADDLGQPINNNNNWQGPTVSITNFSLEDNNMQQKQLMPPTPMSPTKFKPIPQNALQKPNIDTNRMRSVLTALNKQNESIKKELNLYKKQFNEKVEDIEQLNSQIKRLQSKVNFGVKSMFENKLKEAFSLKVLPGLSGLPIAENPKQEDQTEEEQIGHGFLATSSQNTNSQQAQQNFWDLDQRMDGLKPSHLKILDQLSELGVQQFLQACKKDVKYDSQLYLEIIATSYLSYKNFSESINFIVNFLLYAQSLQDLETSDKNGLNGTIRLMSIYKNKLPNFFNCTKVTIWVKDLSENQIWTTHQNKLIVRKGPQQQEIIYQALEQKKILIFRRRDEITYQKQYQKNIEHDFYQEEERKNLMIIPIISDTSGQAIGAFEIMNFRVVNDSQRAIISSDHSKFAMMLAKFASSILDKEKIESHQKRETNLVEKFSYFSRLIIQCKNMNQLYQMLKLFVKEIFNSSVLHIILRKGEDQIVVYNENQEPVEESIKVGICGDFLQRQIRRKIAIRNAYEDPRYNKKVDIGVSNQIILMPILLQKFDGESEIIGMLQYENNNYKIDFNEQRQVRNHNLKYANESYLADDSLANQIHKISGFIAAAVDYIMRKDN
ncbi:UNKNOWN [Stylonychia lemnae]|uniref:GAF domain-containing protein n=1 Tax=Stylonychia lemnae TaxID=5949 RepID=A0A078B623_STYLE|nr:UNKNOWN [Stylonychia lemnae]|eukprot:CDW88953.1 UNKNOWN [Stylonychia lemnae]